MPETLSIILPLTMAVVLVASGVAKLRHPDDLAGWIELGVPPAFRRDWLVRVHPWGEIALGAALALLGGILGLLAALVAVLLMGAYTWLVVGVFRRTDDASCACFGTRTRVTRMTVVRNVWLVLLAAAAASVVWVNPLLGGAVAGTIASEAGPWWILGAAVVAITAVLVMWRDVEPEAPQPFTAIPDGEDDDYVRTRTPHVPVTLGDGTIVSLRDLASRRPMLVLAVSETCGACEPVIESLPAYRALLPELAVQFLVMATPEASRLTDTTEPQTLHDPNGYVRGSIADWSGPSAVLFGADGLLAGGPVSGHEQIHAFVEDVYESLHGERPAEGWLEAAASPLS